MICKLYTLCGDLPKSRLQTGTNFVVSEHAEEFLLVHEKRSAHASRETFPETRMPLLAVV